MKAFRGGCITRALPLTYDDSLSYYEVLSKLIARVNELSEALDGGIEEYIREELDRLFIDAMYDEEEETLILILSMEEING